MRWTEGVARNLLQEPRVGGIVVYYRDVTARKATEQQLKETEDRYGHLFSSAADVIFEADAEGYFRFVNPQTLRLFEFAQDEVIGRRFTEFIRADYRPQILQHYYKQTTEGRLNSYIEFPAITKSGKEVWLGQNAWIMTDTAGKLVGMQAVARDITERRRSEDALRTAEAKYRALVEQSLMGVYIMQNNRLVYVNPKAADLLGYTQQEMIDSPSPLRFRARAGSAAGDGPARAPRSRARAERAARRARRPQGRRGDPGRGVLLGDRVRQRARDPHDRARHQRSREARGSAAPGAEDGGGRPARRRHRPRLQQPADRDPRQRRADVAPREGGSEHGGGGRRDPACRRSRRLAHAPAAGIQPQAGAAADRARPQRNRQQRVTNGAPPDRHRRAVAPRSRAIGLTGACRSGAGRAGAAESDRQCA